MLLFIVFNEKQTLLNFIFFVSFFLSFPCRRLQQNTKEKLTFDLLRLSLTLSHSLPLFYFIILFLLGVCFLCSSSLLILSTIIFLRKLLTFVVVMTLSQMKFCCIINIRDSIQIIGIGKWK